MFHSSLDLWGSPGASIAQRPTNPFSSDQSTLDSLAVMAVLSRKDAASPTIRSLAHSIAAHCPTLRSYCQAVWFWVHDHISFDHHENIVDSLSKEGIPVPLDAQLLIGPVSLLKMPRPSGDCAIFSTLTAALLLSTSIDTWFRVTCSDKNEPDVWSHVYVVCMVDGEVIPMDTSHGHFFGWETTNKFRELNYKV